MGVHYLRKMKTESILNQRFDEFSNHSLNQYEKYQKYFQQAIESLSDQMRHKRSFYGESKKRYYSGDFRVTHKSKFNDHKDSNLAEAMDLVIGYSYY